MNSRRNRTAMIVGIAVVAAAAAAVAWHEAWWPKVQRRISGAPPVIPGHSQHDHDHDAHGGHDHDAHEHDHPPADHEAHGNNEHVHDEAGALELSEVAWKNIGLKTGTVQLQTFTRAISVPAMVVERPGRSQVVVTAPLTGIVTRVYALEGEAVEPGHALFDLRLTHEDLVTAQRDFLRSAQELDVVKREIARLESVGEGVIAGRRVVEQQYEQDRIEAALHAQRQALLLHGLSEQQADRILETRQLLHTLTVVAPPYPSNGEHHDVEHLFHIQKVHVHPGMHVTSGDRLAGLADHCLLYVEGQAFEDDIHRLMQAARAGWQLQVAAVTDRRQREVQELELLYVADHVDTDSRALHFYLRLPNELIRDEQRAGHRFVAWKHRPGQRMEVQVPLGEPWEDQIVLPASAVVEEGAEAFVFQHNGDHFDRVPVHVLYRDKDRVVVERQAQLVGTTVAMSGAYQMHLALKYQAGGVEPHGHTH